MFIAKENQSLTFLQFNNDTEFHIEEQQLEYDYEH